MKKSLNVMLLAAAMAVSGSAAGMEEDQNDRPAESEVAFVPTELGQDPEWIIPFENWPAEENERKEKEGNSKPEDIRNEDENKENAAGGSLSPTGGESKRSIEDVFRSVYAGNTSGADAAVRSFEALGAGLNGEEEDQSDFLNLYRCVETGLQVWQDESGAVKAADSLAAVHSNYQERGRRIAELKKEKEAVESQIEELGQENSKNKSRVEELEQQNAVVEAKIKELEQQSADAESEANELRQQGSDNEAEIEKLRQQGTNNKAEIEELKQKVAAAESEIEELRQKNAEDASKIKELEEQNARYESDLEEKREEFKKDGDQLKQRQSALEESRSKLKEERALLDIYKGQLDEQAKNVEARELQLRSGVIKLSEQEKKLREDREDLTSRLLKLEGEEKEMFSRSGKSAKELLEFAQKKKKLMEQEKELNEMKDRLAEEGDALQEEKNTFQKKARQAEKEWSSKQEELEKKEADLSKENEEMRMALKKEFDEKAKASEEQMRKREGELEERNEALEKEKDKFTDIIRRASSIAGRKLKGKNLDRDLDTLSEAADYLRKSSEFITKGLDQIIRDARQFSPDVDQFDEEEEVKSDDEFSPLENKKSASEESNKEGFFRFGNGLPTSWENAEKERREAVAERMKNMILGVQEIESLERFFENLRGIEDQNDSDESSEGFMQGLYLTFSECVKAGMRECGIALVRDKQQAVSFSGKSDVKDAFDLLRRVYEGQNCGEEEDRIVVSDNLLQLVAVDSKGREETDKTQDTGGIKKRKEIEEEEEEADNLPNAGSVKDREGIEEEDEEEEEEEFMELPWDIEPVEGPDLVTNFFKVQSILANKDSRISKLIDEKSGLSAKLQQADEEQQRLSDDLDKAGSARDELQEMVNSLKISVESLSSEKDAVTEQLEAKDKEAADALTQAERYKAREVKMRQQISALNEEVSQLKTRLSTQLLENESRAKSSSRRDSQRPLMAGGARREQLNQIMPIEEPENEIFSKIEMESGGETEQSDNMKSKNKAPVKNSADSSSREVLPQPKETIAEPKQSGKVKSKNKAPAKNGADSSSREVLPQPEETIAEPKQSDKVKSKNKAPAKNSADSSSREVLPQPKEAEPKAVESNEAESDIAMTSSANSSSNRGKRATKRKVHRKDQQTDVFSKSSKRIEKTEDKTDVQKEGFSKTLHFDSLRLQCFKDLQASEDGKKTGSQSKKEQKKQEPKKK